MKSLFLALFGGAFFVFGEAFSMGKCSRQCVETYKGKNDEKLSLPCRQGCNLFAILQFSAQKGDDVSKVRDQCATDCKSAFKTKVNKKEACELGCAKQKPLVDKNGQFSFHAEMDSSSPLFKYFNRAMEKARRKMGFWRGGLFSQMQHMMDDDTMYSDMEREMDRMEQRMNGMMGDVGRWMGHHHHQRGRMPILKLRFLDDGKDNFDNFGLKVGTLGSVESDTAKEPKPPVVKESRASYDGVDPESSWLSCLSRSGRRLSHMTLWLLCIGLMLCIVSILWILLNIFKSAPKRRPMLILKAGKELEGNEYTAGPSDKQFLHEAHLKEEEEKAAFMAQAPPPYEEQEPKS